MSKSFEGVIISAWMNGAERREPNGWHWGENLKPHEDPGFSAVYTLALPLGAVPIACGIDPLKLTVFSMALTAMPGRASGSTTLRR